METKATDQLTDLQRDDEKFSLLKDQIKSIGRVWVAKAVGYSDQSITDYMSLRNSSKRLENSIIANLGNALKLREESEEQETKQAWENLKKSIEQLA